MRRPNTDKFYEEECTMEETNNLAEVEQDGEGYIPDKSVDLFLS